MTTVSIEATEEVKELIEKLLNTGLFKSKSEIVRESIREMSIKYGVYPGERARKILDKKIKGKLSKTVKEVRSA